MSLRYHEWQRYSPQMDDDVLRISVRTPDGEYWREVNAGEGARLRQARDDAQQAIALAIRRGLPPGEVKEDEAWD